MEPLKVAVGAQLSHKVWGPCRVTAMLRDDELFLAAFPDGASRRFTVLGAEKYFSPPDPLAERYRFKRPLLSEDRPLLEAIDRGDAVSAATLIRSLEKRTEFAVIDLVCERLKD